MRRRIIPVRREPEVNGIVARLPEIVQHRIDRDFEKLSHRGLGGVTAPLVIKHTDDVFVLYSTYDGIFFVGLAFFMDDGDGCLRVFWSDVTKGRKLDRSMRKSLHDAYNGIRGSLP